MLFVVHFDHHCAPEEMLVAFVCAIVVQWNGVNDAQFQVNGMITLSLWKVQTLR